MFSGSAYRQESGLLLSLLGFCAELLLKQKLSLQASRMWQWRVRRSSSAVVILASPKTLDHSLKLRLVVITALVRSYDHESAWRKDRLGDDKKCQVKALTCLASDERSVPTLSMHCAPVAHLGVE